MVQVVLWILAIFCECTQVFIRDNHRTDDNNNNKANTYECHDSLLPLRFAHEEWQKYKWTKAIFNILPHASSQSNQMEEILQKEKSTGLQKQVHIKNKYAHVQAAFFLRKIFF